MMKISLTKVRFALFGTAVVLLIAIGTGIWMLNAYRARFVDRSLFTMDAEGADDKTYMRREELSSASSSKERVAEELAKAFSEHRLYEAASWPIAQFEDASLVLATPTETGKEEQFSCGAFYGYPYCGLYVTTPTTSRLLLWGESLTGLQDVEAFPDPDHAIIGSAWSFLNFSTITHQLLNLRTGFVAPLLNIEIDLTDTTVNMHAAGQGSVVTLFVSGERVTGILSPVEVTLRDANERVVYQMPKAEVDHLAANALKRTDGTEPLIVLPGKDDVPTGSVHLQLFGIAYLLDLRLMTLKPLVSFE